jgi:hypothetical protein
MTDQTEPTPADRYAASIRRQVDLGTLLDSEAAQETRRYLMADGNGVTWQQLLREIGGIENLGAVLDTAGERPDPERINPVIDQIFARTAVTRHRGMVVTRRPINRD